MASVDWDKVKTAGEVKLRIMAHCDVKKRQEHSHSNKDINPELTPFNFQLYEDPVAIERYDNRIKYLDSLPNANTRKDRVRAVSLSIPVPEDLGNEEHRHEFFDKTHEVLESFFGEQNLVNMYYHLDEVHPYTDPKTGEERMSLEHIHAVVIPEKGDKLVCKAVSTKENMRALNNAMESVCRDMGSRFMTGEKYRSRAEVEDLKAMSQRVELEKVAECAHNVAEGVLSDSGIDKANIQLVPRVFASKEDKEDARAFTDKLEHIREQLVPSNDELENKAMELLMLQRELDEKGKQLGALADSLDKRYKELNSEEMKWQLAENSRSNEFWGFLEKHISGKAIKQLKDYWRAEHGQSKGLQKNVDHEH